MTTFASVLEAVEELPLDAQEELVDIVSKRLHEQKRQELIREVKMARKEFDEGKAVEVTPETLFDDLGL